MNTTQSAQAAAPSIVDANPSVVWFTVKPETAMSVEDEHEWHEELREYMRTLGVVVHIEASFGVAIPIGREVLASDRHEIANWVVDHYPDAPMVLQLSYDHPVADLLDFCEGLLTKARRDKSGPLAAAGVAMVLRVITHALLAWRKEVSVLLPAQ